MNKPHDDAEESSKVIADGDPTSRIDPRQGLWSLVPSAEPGDDRAMTITPVSSIPVVTPPASSPVASNGRSGPAGRTNGSAASAHRADGHSFDGNGLEVLTRAECLGLLRDATIARVGITSEALPVVVPVNITVATLDPVRGPEVIIRSVEGTKLLAALRHAVIAIETDDIEPVTHAGWSVLVRGATRMVEDPDEISRAEQLPLAPWASPDADRYIAVGLDVVSGRRLVPWHRPG